MPDDIRLERVTKSGEGVEALAQIKGRKFIKVGIVSGTGEHPNGENGQTLAEVGWWNEFGTKRIPERPFLRTGLRDNIGDYRTIIQASLKAIFTKKTEESQALAVLGTKAQADVQRKIVSVTSPPNAQTTIDLKGSSSPLQNIGALKQHIRWAPVNNA